MTMTVRRKPIDVLFALCLLLLTNCKFCYRVLAIDNNGTSGNTEDYENFNVDDRNDVISSSEGTFIQTLMVSDGKIFTEEQVHSFQIVYIGFTSQFAPIALDSETADITDTVTTTCIVQAMEGIASTNATTSSLNDTNHTEVRKRRHRNLLRSRTLQEEETQELAEPYESELELEAVDMVFVMTYESQQHDVTGYDILFHTWINDRLETVKEQLNLLGLNVTQVQNASQIIDESDTLTPTFAFTESEEPVNMETTTDSPTLVPMLTAPPVMVVSLSNGGNPNGEWALIFSSLFLATCILVVGLFVYWRKRKAEDHSCLPSSVKKSKRRGSTKKTQDKRVTDDMNQEDVQKVVAATDRTTPVDHKRVRIQEPTPSISSSSSNDGNGKTTPPTSNKYFDDRVHHYYRKKNAKKQKKNSSTSKPIPSSLRSSSGRSSSLPNLKDQSRENNMLPSQSPTDLQVPYEQHHHLQKISSLVSMKMRLQQLEDLRATIPQQEYEERRSDILLAALQ